MTVTFTPATNRYAAIIAICAEPRPPAPRHPAIFVIDVTALAEPVTVGLAARHARREAFLADYAAGLATVTTPAEHGDLTRRLRYRYDVSKATAWDWAFAYRVEHGLYRPGEVR